MKLYKPDFAWNIRMQLTHFWPIEPSIKSHSSPLNLCSTPIKNFTHLPLITLPPKTAVEFPCSSCGISAGFYISLHNSIWLTTLLMTRERTDWRMVSVALLVWCCLNIKQHNICFLVGDEPFVNNVCSMDKYLSIRWTELWVIAVLILVKYFIYS